MKVKLWTPCLVRYQVVNLYVMTDWRPWGKVPTDEELPRANRLADRMQELEQLQLERELHAEELKSRRQKKKIQQEDQAAEDHLIPDQAAEQMGNETSMDESEKL